MKNFYTPILLVVFTVLSAAILFPTVLIWHSGEGWKKSQIASSQMKNDSIVSFGLVNEEVTYKKAVYKIQNPEIVMIGSSRILQYRQNMFNRPFYNIGRGLILYDLKGEVDFLLSNPNLKTVIWGLDYWNFGHRFCEEPVKYHKTETAVGVNSQNIDKFSNIIPREILHVWPMIFDNRVSLSMFLKYISVDWKSAKNKIGLRPLYSDKGGYLKDGFYVYLDLFMDRNRLHKERKELVDDLVKGRNPYQIPETEKFCDKPISDILYLKEKMNKKGIEFIVFLPPLPKRHAQLITSTPHAKAFHKKMKDVLSAIEGEIMVHDYLTPEYISYEDREFIDQMHPGEVISYRILLDIAHKEPDFRSLLDSKFMADQVLSCSGEPVCSDGLDVYLPQGM